MYGATATLEMEHLHKAMPEREQCARADQLLAAVSLGWDGVIRFLDSCDLDWEARVLLQGLKRDDWEC
jgi:hypothetical protein